MVRYEIGFFYLKSFDQICETLFKLVNKLNSKDSNILIKCWIEFLMGSAVISCEFFGFNILSDYIKRDYPY